MTHNAQERRARLEYRLNEAFRTSMLWYIPRDVKEELNKECKKLQLRIDAIDEAVAKGVY